METDEKNIDLIEAFFQGKLKGSELTSFLERRREDPAFDEAAEDYLLIFHGLRTQGERDFTQKLQKWEQEIEGAKQAKVVPMRRYLAIAATLLILLVPITYWFIYNYNTAKTNEDLFSSYFQPYGDVISVRSSEVNNLELGMTYYNEKQYDKAIEYLELVADDDPQKKAADLYLGIAYLATNQTEKGKVVFSSLTEGDADFFKEVAEWNLALTHLKEGDNQSAKDVLKRISDEENHLFKSESASLKQELD